LSRFLPIFWQFLPFLPFFAKFSAKTIFKNEFVVRLEELEAQLEQLTAVLHDTEFCLEERSRQVQVTILQKVTNIRKLLCTCLYFLPMYSSGTIFFGLTLWEKVFEGGL
jgi:hypothetical protein